MLQNDIGEGNNNDGFIIPMAHVPTPDNPEPSGDRFITYNDFRSRYWNRFPQSVTWLLGVCTMYPVNSLGNFGIRSCFGLW